MAKSVILVYSNDYQRKTILPGCNVIIVYFRYVIVFQNKSRHITIRLDVDFTYISKIFIYLTKINVPFLFLLLMLNTISVTLDLTDYSGCFSNAASAQYADVLRKLI